MVGLLTWVFDKVASPLLRLLKHPTLDIERAEPAGSKMVDPSNVSVNIAITIRNTGRAAAESYRAVARATRGDGVSLSLRNAREPGDATTRREEADDVVEWQSTEPWPPQHTRSIECALRLRQDLRVLIAVTLIAPHMKPVHREVEVQWRGQQPEIQVLA